MTVTPSRIFTLEGRALVLDSAKDIQPHLEPLISNDDVEEVRLNGNTLGVEACEALARALRNKKKLQVPPHPSLPQPSLSL